MSRVICSLSTRCHYMVLVNCDVCFINECAMQTQQLVSVSITSVYTTVTTLLAFSAFFSLTEH